MRFILTCLLTIFLTSCGFHLRGQIPIAPPLHLMAIQTQNPYGPLTHYLRQYLKTSGVCVVDNPCQASTILEILNEEIGQQLVSFSVSQQTRQYNLTITVRFQVTDTCGRILVPPQTVSELRTVTMQSSQMLGGGNEANILYECMRRAIIFSIMNRLSADDIPCLLSHPCRCHP